MEDRMRFRSISGQMVAAVTLLVALGVSGLIYYAGQASLRTVMQAEKKDMQHVATDAVRQLDMFLEFTSNTLRAFSKDRFVRQGFEYKVYRTKAQEYLAGLLPNFELYRAALAFSPQGEELYVVLPDQKEDNSLKLPEDIGRDIADRLGTGQVHVISKVFDVLGTPCFLQAIPVAEDEGESLVGSLAVLVDWGAYCRQYINNAKIGQSGYPFVLDSKGITIDHGADSSLMYTDQSGQGFARRAMEQQKGTLEYTWREDKKILAFDTVQDTGWTVCMSAYADELAADALRLRNFLILAGVAMIVILIFAIVLWLRRLVILPIMAIQHFVRNVSQGDMNASLQGKFRFELAQMSEDLKAMVQKLKDRLGFSQGILNGMATACIVTDEQDRATFVNEQFIGFVGLKGKPSEHLGKTVHELLGQNSRETITGQVLAHKKSMTGIEIFL
jgi:methyl-accepting chemotaxis protein